MPRGSGLRESAPRGHHLLFGAIHVIGFVHPRDGVGVAVLSTAVVVGPAHPGSVWHLLGDRFGLVVARSRCAEACFLAGAAELIARVLQHSVLVVLFVKGVHVLGGDRCISGESDVFPLGGQQQDRVLEFLFWSHGGPRWL